MKSNGFILVELLVALTICAITMGLFVHSSKNRAQMLIILEENYSLERLKNDFLILAKIKKIDEINPKHYLPLEIEVSRNEVEIKSQRLKDTVLQND